MISTQPLSYPHSLPNTRLPNTPAHPHSAPPHALTFNQLLESADLPCPGPDYYAARRALWLTPRPVVHPPPPRTPSTSRQKLEAVLNSPSAVYSDRAWHSGIEKVWKGLSAGGSLKHRLPMALIIKIIHASWVRDNTWPAGMEAPEPDDILLDNTTPEIPPPPAHPYPHPQPTAPWMIINGAGETMGEEKASV